jgi:serine/threonine protein kinase
MRCIGCGSDVSADAASCAACGTPAVAIAPGTLLAGRYEIEALIGSGALGRVFRAHDRTLNERVALKLLHPETTQSPDLTQRFRNEIRLARRVRHVNVCAIHEYGEDGPLQFVAMELVDGIDLQRELRASGPLPAATLFDVALQMARGMAAIHDAGVIHRDLKTSNIVRDRHGAVRLLDFGIAKRANTTGTLALTGGERVVGTPEYMSPEQIRGGELDLRSDLYSFGVVLFELCTGTLPFEGKTPLDTMLRQVSEPPPLYGERARLIPPSLVSLLRRTLAKDPAGRPASARELETELLFAQRAAFPEGVPEAASAGLPDPPTAPCGPELVAAATTPQAPPLQRPPVPPMPPRPPTPPNGAIRPAPPAPYRTEVLPRRAAPPRPPTPPPPPIVAAREAAAAAALDGERTFVELPALPGPSRPPQQPPPVPRGEPRGAQRPRPSRPSVALLAAVGLMATFVLLAVRSRLAPGSGERTAPAAAEAASPAVPATAPEVSQPPVVPATAPEASQPAAAPATAPVIPPHDGANTQAATEPLPGMSAAPPTPAAADASAVRAESAEPPATTPAPPPTPRRVRRAAAPAPSATPVPVPTPTPLPSGTLSVDARPRADVVIDGRPVGLTPLGALAMEPGEHALELSHPEFWPRSKRVVLFPGALLRLEVDLEWEGVRRSAAQPYLVPGAIDPGLASAAALVAKMEWREAIAALWRVVRRLEVEEGRRGDLARAHFYLGVAHLELDEPTRATASFNAALASDAKLKPPPAAFPPRVLGFFNHVREQRAKKPQG